MIEIRIGNCVILRAWNADVEQIAALQMATLRRFRQGLGFPATFVGFNADLDRQPAGHKTVWFHPSMPVQFDYGTDYEPVKVDDAQVEQAMCQMDSSALGVVIGNAKVSAAFANEVYVCLNVNVQ